MTVIVMEEGETKREGLVERGEGVDIDMDTSMDIAMGGGRARGRIGGRTIGIEAMGMVTKEVVRRGRVRTRMRGCLKRGRVELGRGVGRRGSNADQDDLLRCVWASMILQDGIAFW